MHALPESGYNFSVVGESSPMGAFLQQKSSETSNSAVFPFREMDTFSEFVGALTISNAVLITPGRGQAPFWLPIGELVGEFPQGGTYLLQSNKQIRIFVVDDEFIIASSLGLILRQKGFDAISFTAPREALEAARSQAPDLLISDVAMPHVSGFDLAIQIQKQCPDCRVLLFSGQAVTAGMLEAARASGHNFEILSKPIHPTDLLARIAETTREEISLPPLTGCPRSGFSDLGNHEPHSVHAPSAAWQVPVVISTQSRGYRQKQALLRRQS